MEVRAGFRNGAIYFLVIAAFGIAVPYAKGLGFLDPVLLSAYACVGLLFAGPMAAQAFAVRPESLKQAVKWILKAAVVGEAVAVAMLACGIATVFLKTRPVFFPPDLETMFYAVLLGFTASLATATLSAWIV